jgi:hypothetical protein
VPGRVSPMLWAVGLRPRLLLPAGLWPKLDSQQRAALLLHELAHWWRGDHWIRVLELATTCLYWWHPVVWWARRELHEAEEQCCDAWVVWALPGAARSYALALVETLDFLSEARPVLPAAASGVGQVPDLRRRLTMIMRGSVPRRLGWCGFLSVAGIGAVLLPLLPTWAQEGPTPTPEQPPKIERGGGGNQDTERAREELKRLEQEMARMRERIGQMEQFYRQARERLHEAESRREERPAFIVIIQDGQGREVRRLEARRGETIRIPDGQRVDEAGRGPFGGMMSGMRGMGVMGGGGGLMLPGSQGGAGVGGVPGSLGGPFPPAGQPPQAGAEGPKMPPGMNRGPSEDERIRNLERRLEKVLRAVEEMRREMQRPGAPPRPDNRRNQPRGDSRDPEGANRGEALPEIKSGVIRRQDGAPATSAGSLPAAEPAPAAPMGIPERGPVPPPSVQSPSVPQTNPLPPAPGVGPPATSQPAAPAAPVPGAIPAAPASPSPTGPPASGR